MTASLFLSSCIRALMELRQLNTKCGFIWARNACAFNCEASYSNFIFWRSCFVIEAIRERMNRYAAAAHITAIKVINHHVSQKGGVIVIASVFTELLHSPAVLVAFTLNV